MTAAFDLTLNAYCGMPIPIQEGDKEDVRQSAARLIRRLRGEGKGAAAKEQNAANARRYVAAIRNAAKQRYATEYLHFLEARGEGMNCREPARPTDLSGMAAQAVRMRLHKFMGD